MEKVKHTIICLFILNYISWGQSQGKNYTINDGLSNYRVQSIFQDSEGFMWIGTQDGLNRFDGTEFKAITHQPDNPKSLSDGNILCITEDNNGLIWIGIDGGGVNILDKKTNKISHYFDSPEFKKNRLQYVKHIFIDKNNIAWISTWGGLIRFDIKTKKHNLYSYDPTRNSVISSDVKCSIMDANKHLWIATSNGLSKLDTQTGVFKNFNTDSNEIPLPTNRIRHLYIDSTNTLWIGTSEDLFAFEIDSKKHAYFKIDEKTWRSNLINKILEDQNGAIWLCTEAGIYTTERDFVKTKNTYFIKLPTHIETNSIIENQNGQIWFGSRNNGLSVIKTQPEIFNTLFYPGSPEISKQCRTIIKGKNNSIWFPSFKNGIINYNPKTDQYTNQIHHPEIFQNKVEALLLDKSDNMWIGTYLDGVYVHNFKTQKLKQIKIKKVITYLFSNDDQIIWVGTGKGIHFFNSEQKEIESPYNYLPEIINESHIYFIEKDSKNDIWIGTMHNGVFKINATGTVKRYGLQEEYSCITFYEDVYSETYYLGMRNGGLRKITPDGKVIKITTKDGLSSNTITGITRNGENLWASSNLGISRIPINLDKKIQTFDKNDGLASSEFYKHSKLVLSDGTIFFGGTHGICSFNPKNIKPQKNIQKTILTDIKVLNKAIELDTVINYKNQLNLKYNKNIITIDFSSISFDQPKKTTYQYKLEGFDQDWVSSGHKNSATYTNLSPGNYCFRVKATNHAGLSSKYPAHIKLIITPPFWQTWWFYSILFLLLGSGILGIIKARENKLIAEKEIAQFKLQALRSQMNPHFIFNSLNSIQHFIVRNESRFALDYLSKFSRLVRKILENSVQNTTSLSEEIKFLQNYVEIESLRFDRTINFKIHMDEFCSNKEIQIPSMLIQPYVENAIIHGLMHLDNHIEPKLSLSFVKKGDYLNVSIIDNGIGRTASQAIKKRIKPKHKSLGLSITKSRLETLNKRSQTNFSVYTEDILSKKETVIGTKIVINIPLKE